MIDTGRLLLRFWRDDDGRPFAAICADPEVMKWIGDGTTRSHDEVREAIKRYEHGWSTRGYGLFAVDLKESGRLIGFAGFIIPTFLPEIMPAVELGWRLGRPYWGRGYGTEAAAAALDFGRTHCGLESVVSICQVGNAA
ncbi:MAG: GNAT family N-acetyltransferase, partial [Alphaproteobacteria bacterium]